MTATLLLALAACAGPHFTYASLVTSSAQLSTGRRIPQQSFSSTDIVVVLVDVTWPELDQDGGTHTLERQWYRDGQLITDHTSVSHFRSSPFTLGVHRAASTLGVGHFELRTLIDGQLVAANDLDISNQASPRQ